MNLYRKFSLSKTLYVSFFKKFSKSESYLRNVGCNLPLYHKDPFDRILVAQAMNHSLVLISRDVAFDAYPVQRVWL